MVHRLSSLGDEMVTLRDAVERMLNDPNAAPYRGLWSGYGSGTGRIPLALDVFATKDEVMIIAAVPGIEADQIEITINQNTVSLSGMLPNVASSADAKDATWYLHELQHGAFQRSVTLPIEVDAARADATCESGILRLRLPKAETAKPRQIKVRVSEQPIEGQSKRG